MTKSAKIIIVGAGACGLSLAYELASQGHNKIVILDRHVPPVADGSSNDISRVVRFDYADDDYLDLAHKAYIKWQEPRYRGIFHRTPYILGHTKNALGEDWVLKTTKALDKRNLPWTRLRDAQAARSAYPTVTGNLATPPFAGYHHGNAGWADAAKAITQLRNDCIALGVSFIAGHAGTVTEFETDSNGKITAAKTLSGDTVRGDEFVLAAGSWSSTLVDMYKSVLSTAQVVGYVKLTPSEVEKYKNLPIYINCTTGWFNFPPHEETGMLKFAVHGWGYTRTRADEEKTVVKSDTISAPPFLPPKSGQRPNFVPADGEERLRQGLKELLPELADRPFDRTILCWYSDTPTGDFIMDYHPDYRNLFVAGGGSGHLFKFLPVIGEHIAKAYKRELPDHLAKKWRFRTEYKDQSEVFKGDGSRGGPVRRELQQKERARL